MGPVETPEECSRRRSDTVVAILGSGKMARKLGMLWARGGYSVVIGSRNDLRGHAAARSLSLFLSLSFSLSLSG
jgi:hypothetical protein